MVEQGSVSETDAVVCSIYANGNPNLCSMNSGRVRSLHLIETCFVVLTEFSRLFLVTETFGCEILRTICGTREVNAVVAFGCHSHHLCPFSDAKSSCPSYSFSGETFHGSGCGCGYVVAYRQSLMESPFVPVRWFWMAAPRRAPRAPYLPDTAVLSRQQVVVFCARARTVSACDDLYSARVNVVCRETRTHGVNGDDGCCYHARGEIRGMILMDDPTPSDRHHCGLGL
jgi:hypothetical protein